MSDVRGSGKRRTKQRNQSPSLIERPRTRAWIKQEQQQSKIQSAVHAEQSRVEALTPTLTRTRAVTGQNHKKSVKEVTSSNLQVVSKASGSSRNRTRSRDLPTAPRGRARRSEPSRSINPTTSDEAAPQDQDRVAATVESEGYIQHLGSVSEIDPTPFTRETSSDSASDSYTDLSDQSFTKGLPGWYLGATAVRRAMDHRQTPAREGTSTPSEPSPRDPKTFTRQKLSSRHVFVQPTVEKDDRLRELSNHFTQKRPYLPSDMLAQVAQSAQDFITQLASSTTDETSTSALWTFLEAISAWRPKNRLPHVTDSEFGIDINYCTEGVNEAIFQRTVMISNISRHQFHTQELFLFNCEGQFSIPKAGRLPGQGSDQPLTMPKPDLAVFFHFNALTGNNSTAPFPPELECFMRPDNGFNRCFPFLFIEAKRSTNDLDAAYLANMHSASQALFNIFQWFIWLKSYRATRPNLRAVSQHDGDPCDPCDEAAFFDHVRVFSIALNATYIDVRIHRAEWTPDKQNLSYRCEKVCAREAFKGSEACHFVQTILLEYAEKKLLDILKSLYRSVSECFAQISHEARQQGKTRGKRTQGTEGSKVTKKDRSLPSSQVTLDSPPVDMQSSFGITNGLRLGEEDG